MIDANVTTIRLPKGINSLFRLEAVKGGVLGCGSKCFSVDSTSQEVELVSLSLKRNNSLANLFGLQFVEGFGSLWTNGWDRKDNAIHRLDPKTHQETSKISLPPGLAVVFIAKDSVWAFSWESRLLYLYRVDPQANQVTAKIAVGKGPGWELGPDAFLTMDSPHITVAEGAAWALQRDGILRQLDLDSGRFKTELRIGPRKGFGSYSGMIVGEGAIWITEAKEEANLIRVDPKTNQVVATIPLGGLAESPVVGGGFVWVSAYARNSTTHFVWKIDPRTNHVVGKILHWQGAPLLPSGLPHLTAGEDGIWAWSSNYNYIWHITF